MYTTIEAAAKLGCYRHQVARLADELERGGRLRVYRCGRARLIPAEGLELIRQELEKRPGWARRPATPAA